MAALDVHDLHVRYGSAVAVERLSMTVAAGEVCGLVGPNGSGKSSTIAAIAGVIEPSAGSVFVDGIDHRVDPVGYARRLGVVPQQLALYEELSAIANLTFFGGLHGLGRRDARRRAAEVLALVGLETRANDPVGRLSGGMQRRVNLAGALVHRPALLLLDEPTVGLDSASRIAVFAALHELTRSGTAVLLATHLRDEIDRHCDRLVALDRGRRVDPTTVVGTVAMEAIVAEPLDAARMWQIRELLAEWAEVFADGRRLRVVAADGVMLGRALAVLLDAGVALESFHTTGPMMAGQGEAWAA